MNVTFPSGRFVVLLSLPLALLASPSGKPASLAEFQARAAKAKMDLTLPDYPRTAADIKAQAEKAIADADAALDAVTKQDPKTLNFTNTFVAADQIGGRVLDAYLVIGTVAESATSKEMRDVANEMSVKLQEWSVGL